MLQGGPGPPFLQGSAGRIEVRQEGGGFQWVGVRAESAGWNYRNERAVQISRNQVTKVLALNYFIARKKEK